VSRTIYQSRLWPAVIRPRQQGFLPLCGRSSSSPRSRLLIGPSGYCWRRPDRPAEPSCCFDLSAGFGIHVSSRFTFDNAAPHVLTWPPRPTSIPPLPCRRSGRRGVASTDTFGGPASSRSPRPHVGSAHDEFGQSRAAVTAALAQPDQRQAAAAGGDRCGEVGVPGMAARLAPDMHPVAGAGDRAWASEGRHTRAQRGGQRLDSRN
jgi:hypothetical protein